MTRTYEDSIKAIETLLLKHNEALGEGAHRLEVPTILARVKADKGATDAESLALLTEGDLTDLGIPVTRARQIVKLFGAETAPAPAPPPPAPTAPVQVGTQHTVVTLEEVENFSDSELLARFQPDRPESKVGKELDARARGQAFLIFAPDGTLEREASAKRLALILAGRPLTATVMVGGRPVTPRRVGEPYLAQTAPENPLRPGEPLADPEICTITNESWAGIAPKVRQIVYLGLTETGEVTARDPEAMRLVIAAAKAGLDEVVRRYPKAAAMLEVMPAGRRPDLEIDLSNAARSGGAARPPFREGGRTLERDDVLR